MKTNSRPGFVGTVIVSLLLGGFVLFAALEAGGQEGLILFDDSQEQQEERLVELTALFSVSAAEPSKTYRAAALIDIDSGWHINSAAPYQDWLIPAALMVDTIPEAMPLNVTYPEGEDATLIDETISVYGGRVTVLFDIRIAADAVDGEYQLPFRLAYQPCDHQTCRAPDTIETVLTLMVGEGGRPTHGDVFAKSNQAGEPVESGETAVSDTSDLERLIRKYGFWGYILALGLAFVTGVLLSFSPCTYPMIPITVSIFAGQERSVGRGFFLSLVYVGSMAVVYGIMGLVVSLVGGVFGSWLASTPVVIGIAAVFVVFSLSMFGLYELQVPLFLRQRLGQTRAGGGVVGSVILGLVAALVVSPCVGPFVAGILLYIATTGSPAVGFLVLFVFAVGLGTLYIIIGTFSTAINNLPRSGEWMESVKRFFGFVLLLMALYFLRTIISDSLLAVLTGLLLLTFGVFAGGLDRLTPETGNFFRLKKLLGILALTVGFYLLLGSLVRSGLIHPPVSQWPPTGPAAIDRGHQDLIAWQTDLEVGLAEAAREGRPVLIDTWATWCVNCRVLDKKTFGSPEVAAEAQRFVPIKVQLETAGSLQTREFMSRFGLPQYSLPTTLLLDSDGNVKRILTGVVSPQQMIAEMRKVS